jgi:mortality factor 4-like protein 1
MSTSTPGAQTVTFTPNERVLCYHGPLIYEAKVLKVTTVDEVTTTTGIIGPHYFVHYKGWKQT